SEGPSKNPHPCAQAYSAPERFTPRSRTGRAVASTSWLPCTCSAGAPEDGGGSSVVPGGRFWHAASAPIVSTAKSRGCMLPMLTPGPTWRPVAAFLFSEPARRGQVAQLVEQRTE